MKGKLISLREYAKKHGVALTTARQKCERGNVRGAVKIGRNWCVPEDSPYEDHRITSGRYVKLKRNRDETIE